MVFEHCFDGCGRFVSLHRLSERGKIAALSKGYSPSVGLPEITANGPQGKEWWELQGLEICPIRRVLRFSRKEFWLN